MTEQYIIAGKKKSAINALNQKKWGQKDSTQPKKVTNDYCTRFNTGKTSWWKICSRNAIIQLLTTDWAFRICFVGPTVQIFKLAQFIENVQTYLYKTGVSSRI